jgi:hypothetical protein
VERTCGSAAFWAASSSAFFAASSRAFRPSSSFIRSMSPLRMYLFGRDGPLSKALRLEAISALRASILFEKWRRDYLSSVRWSPFYSGERPSTPSQCPTQKQFRGAPQPHIRYFLRKYIDLCFWAANTFFRPLGLMVRGRDTSLFYWVTDLFYLLARFPNTNQTRHW